MRKTTVRVGMFETNSSSMHCVCLNSRCNKDNQHWDDPEYRKLVMKPYVKHGRENNWPVDRIDLTTIMGMLAFGGTFDILSDFIEKLIYVYCSICAESQSYDNYRLICKALDDLIDGFIVYDPAPVIDHQSIGLIENYLSHKEDKVEALRRLLFDDSYVIVIDSDNEWIIEDYPYLTILQGCVD